METDFSTRDAGAPEVTRACHPESADRERNSSYFYSTWMDGFASISGSDREKNADPDADGIDNLMESNP